MDDSVISQLKIFRKDIKNLKEEPYRLENIYSVELAELVSTLCKDMDAIVWVKSQTKNYLCGYAHALLTNEALTKLEEIIDDYLFFDVDDNYYM